MMSERLHQRDLVREFLSYIQVEKGLSTNTLQSYARDLARLQAWAERNRKQIGKLERTDLREWIASMSREGQAPTGAAPFLPQSETAAGANFFAACECLRQDEF